MSIYSPAAKLSDSNGHNPLDIAKNSENDAKDLKEGKVRIVKMLENIDGTIKKYVEENRGSRKLASDGVVDLTETRRLDDGRVVTKDGKVLRKARINNRKAVVCFVLHPQCGQSELNLVQDIREKYSFTAYNEKCTRGK